MHVEVCGEMSVSLRVVLPQSLVPRLILSSFHLNVSATNINDAVLAGARMLIEHPREGSASILILLTDGDPTTGHTKHRQTDTHTHTVHTQLLT